MNVDKFGITIYFSDEKSINLSYKDREELDDALNKIETSKWFRVKDNYGEMIIHSSNINYIRVIEYASSVNDEDDDFIEQGENKGFW
ncbi:hypothetical protein AB4124_06120 [Paenibacillus sp. 2KB_20]|uniref:hypothetical protein n=1 Tax=Paenibacillus sp. 2KB_20 TaxID=3232977 RepID=UPI003F9E2A1D